MSCYNPAVGCTEEEEGLTVNRGADQIPTVHATSALFHLLCGCTPPAMHAGVPLGAAPPSCPSGERGAAIPGGSVCIGLSLVLTL